jgi:hypothetical protein
VGAFGFGIAGLEISHLAVEQRGRERSKALACKVIAYGANVVINTEDLLDHDNRAFGRPFRVSAVSSEVGAI